MSYIAHYTTLRPARKKNVKAHILVDNILLGQQKQLGTFEVSIAHRGINKK